MNLDDPQEWEAAAAEYALGSLDGHERAAVESRLEWDRDLRHEVGAWNERLLDLAELFPAAQPPQAVWARLERSLDFVVRTARVGTVKSRPNPAPDGNAGVEAVDAGILKRSRRRLEVWRMTAFAGMVTAVAFGFFLFARDPLRFVTPEPQLYVAVLAPTGASGGGWLLQIGDGAGFRMLATPFGGVAVPEDKSLELWALPGAAVPPVSLGVLGTAGPTQFAWPSAAGPRPESGVTLAVSVEPSGGSPSGAPTGPIIFNGRLIDAAPE